MIYLAGLLLLALLGTPLFVIIAASALLGFYHEETDLAVVAIELYRLAEMPVLIAIPLFTFAGYLLGESQAPTRLVRLTKAVLGWLPGGLPIVAIVTCALFTAFTGASGVTIIALGALLYPAMKEAGYRDNFNLGLITTSGSLGILLVPALPLILYAVVAQQMSLDESISVNDLFLAGLFPSLLMLVVLSLWSMYQSGKRPVKKETHEKIPVWPALRDSMWELPLPFIVLGGIYSGFFAVSEAAAVTALYVFVVEVLILREISWKALPGVMRQSMVLVGGILIILGVSLSSTNLMIDTEVPTRAFELIRETIDSKLGFLLALNVFLLAVGTMLDIFSALVILVPIMLPVAISYGVHPVHFGIIFLANMQLGYYTPPLGMNLFIASYRFNRSVMTLYRATLPFFMILLMTVLIITYWPDLSLVLLGDQ